MWSMSGAGFSNHRAAFAVAVILAGAAVAVAAIVLTGGGRSSFLSREQANDLGKLAVRFASESGEKHPHDAMVVQSRRRHAINVVWRSDAAVANQRVFVITMKGHFQSPHGPLPGVSSLTFDVDPAQNDRILDVGFNAHGSGLERLGQVEPLALAR